VCSYDSRTTALTGAGYARGEWIELRKAVVALDHPTEAPLEHAVCIDFRGDGVTERVAVELDPESARSLAQAILASLGP
jgi:hypothetical protein